MAIFASTTTSGYSDPMKAMTIKALEQRQKDMMAQQAAQQPDAAMMATIPGGIGHVLGQIGDKMQQGRADQALASQRDVLAQAISGYDPASGAPPPAAIATVAPDMYKDMMQVWAENRRSAAQIAAQERGQNMTLEGVKGGHAVTQQGNQLQADVTREGQGNQAAMETARLEAAERAAAKLNENQELARQATAEETRAAAERKVETDRLAATEQQKVTREGQAPDEVKLARALATGEIDQKTYDALMKKKTAPSAAETEHMVTRQKESVEQQSTLGTLDQALGFIDHPDSIFAGKNADWRTGISGRLPEKLTGLNEKTRENTSSYNKILGGQALAQLTQMKGASSDKDVKINFDIANDPNATVDEKKRAIGVLKEKLAYYIKINNEAITAAGGTAPQLGGGGAGGAAPHPEEGRTYSSPGKPTLIRRNGKLEPM